jgi:hypothetical protein
LWWSQPEAGLSLRNLGALVGGQLGYLSPVVAVLLGWAVVRGVRLARGGVPAAGPEVPGDRASAIRFCLVGTLVPFVLLASICLWSRVAEPHWPLPAYFALLPLAGLVVAEGARGIRRLYGWAVGVAVAFDLLAYVVVLTPVLPALVPEPLYVTKYDIVNELYGWEDVAAAVERRLPAGGVVAGGHYTMCAQLAWNLRDAGVVVGCRTTAPTDFDFRAPARKRLESSPVLFVSDERYPERPAAAGGAAPAEPVEIVAVRRGGTTVRRFVLTSYAAGTLAWPRRFPCDSGGRESN